MNYIKIPHIGSLKDLKLVILDIIDQHIQKGEIDGITILKGIPRFDLLNPAPFIEWFSSEIIFGESSYNEQFPLNFTFESKGMIYIKSGINCHILGSNSSFNFIDKNQNSIMIPNS